MRRHGLGPMGLPIHGHMGHSSMVLERMVMAHGGLRPKNFEDLLEIMPVEEILKDRDRFRPEYQQQLDQLAQQYQNTQQQDPESRSVFLDPVKSTAQHTTTTVTPSTRPATVAATASTNTSTSATAAGSSSKAGSGSDPVIDLPEAPIIARITIKQSDVSWGVHVLVCMADWLASIIFHALSSKKKKHRTGEVRHCTAQISISC